MQKDKPDTLVQVVCIIFFRSHLDSEITLADSYQTACGRYLHRDAERMFPQYRMKRQADSPVTEGDACQQFYILCLHHPAASAVASLSSGVTPGG
jgi:hypothetical protein